MRHTVGIWKYIVLMCWWSTGRRCRFFIDLTFICTSSFSLARSLSSCQYANACKYVSPKACYDRDRERHHQTAQWPRISVDAVACGRQLACRIGFFTRKPRTIKNSLQHKLAAGTTRRYGTNWISIHRLQNPDIFEFWADQTRSFHRVLFWKLAETVWKQIKGVWI